MYELEALTAPGLQRLIDAGAKTVVIPFGSIEHQGGHLQLGADALLAYAVGRAVADRLDAMLAPGPPRRHAKQSSSGMGTLTLRSETRTDVAVEIQEATAARG
jgi:creatinine amidohydrolase